MIIEEHLSRIEQLFQNYKELLNKEQYISLKYQIQGYKEKSLRDQLIIESILNDHINSLQALFIGEAAKLLKEYSSEHFRNIDEMVIQLQKWKLVKFEKKQNYLVLVCEFNYYGKAESIVQCTPYDPDSQFTQKKLKLTIQKNTKNNMKINHQNDQQNDINNILNNPYIDLQTKKKVKIEALTYKPTQDSFVIDQSLLNCTLPENPSTLINRSIMQFNKQQQQAQEYIKISALFPNQSKWALEGRIILKSDIQEFKNKRTGQNQQYFKIIILDCEQETISGLFYEKATQKFFDKLEINKVYIFKNACISQDKTDGSKKITFNEYSIISDSNNFTIPTNPQITISTIKEIQESTLTGSFDIAVVVQEIKSETQNSKTLIVLDQTGKILIKLWGDQYKNVEFKKGEIMVFKGLQIHVYNNQKQLYTGYQTIILKNESVIPELKALKNWLIGKNIDTIFKPQQETQNLDLLQFQELVLKQLNSGNIQQQFNNQVYAYIMEIQERNTMYASCPNSRCLSKMDYLENRKTFKCKKCFIENDQPKYRYILKVTIMDDTSNISATIFDENAQKLLQLSADEFKQLTQLEQHQKLIISSYRQKKIKLQARFREFQGYTQPQYQVDEIEDIDYKMLANEEIKKFEDFDYLLNLSYLL